MAEQRNVCEQTIHVNTEPLKEWAPVNVALLWSATGDVWAGFLAFVAGDYMCIRLLVNDEVLSETVAIVRGGGTLGGLWFRVPCATSINTITLQASGRGRVGNSVLHATDDVPTRHVGSIL